MARAGLGPQWKCLFANDIDEKKAASYAANWGRQGLQICDVADVRPSDLPETADLAWASFPCQDLSLAGSLVGLRGDRSGTFWPFWKLMEQLQREMERKGQGRQFQCLKEFIGGTGVSTYAAPATELEITESAARMTASRLRTRYRELLREEISQTISAAEDMDDEIRQLFQAIAD